MLSEGFVWHKGIGFWLLVAGLLVSCGGGSSFDNVTDVADALRDGGVECHDLEVGSDEIYVREGGRCDLEDADAAEDPLDVESIAIYTFNDSDAQEAWLEIAKGFGGVYVVGDEWIVSTDSQQTAEDVQEAIGGEVE